MSISHEELDTQKILVELFRNKISPLDIFRDKKYHSNIKTDSKTKKSVKEIKEFLEKIIKVNIFENSISKKDKFNLVIDNKIHYYEVLNQKCYICSNMNEINATVQMQEIFNRSGRFSGRPDIEINYFNEEKQLWSFFYIELKTKDKILKEDEEGRNINQIKFKAMCDYLNIPYYMSYNRETFLNILIKEKIIKEIIA